MDDAEMDAFVANISDTVSGRAAKTVIVALRAALAESESERDLAIEWQHEYRRRAESAEQAKQIAERDAARLDWATNNPEAAMREVKDRWIMCGPGSREISFNWRGALDAAISAQP